MRKPRWIANQEAKQQAKQQMFDAWNAVEQFRLTGDCSDFPSLRRYLDDFVHRPSPQDKVFKISGFGILDERITREEYDRMKAAWRQTEAGKNSTYDYPWETPAKSDAE